MLERDIGAVAKGRKFRIVSREHTLTDDLTDIGDTVYVSGYEGNLDSPTFRHETKGKEWFYLHEATELEEAV